MGEAEQDLQDAAQTRALPARDGRIQVVVGDEVKQLQKTADGRTYEDGVLNLSDGREMSWRWWGDPDGTPILRIQGTPGSRKQYNPNPNVQREVGARYLMADRAGYGGSMRKPGRGSRDMAGDYGEVRNRLLSDEGMQGVLSDAPESDGVIMSDPAWQKMSRENTAEALRQGAEGWTDESLAMHGKWDFDPRDVKTSVTWWHGDDDMN